MPIQLYDRFVRNTVDPLDQDSVVADQTARDALPSGIRYLGMIVFVIGDAQHYTLKAGLTNSDWEPVGDAATPFDGGIDNYLFHKLIHADVNTGSTSGLSTGDVGLVHLTGSLTDIHGITPPDITKSSLLILVNSQGAPVTLHNESAGAGSAQQRMRLGQTAPLIMKDNQALFFTYSNSVSGYQRWYLIGGAGGDDIQGETTAQAVANGGTIALNQAAKKQTIFISSTSGEAILDVQPFGTDFPDYDGAEITLVGDSNGQPVRMIGSEIGQYVAYGNFGELLFSRGMSATFKWSATLEKYVCISRNF